MFTGSNFRSFDSLHDALVEPAFSHMIVSNYWWQFYAVGVKRVHVTGHFVIVIGFVIKRGGSVGEKGLFACLMSVKTIGEGIFECHREKP